MKTPVDVLYLIGQLSVGGTERQLLLLIKYLDRTKFRPSVICLSEQAPLATALEELDCPTFVLSRSTHGRMRTLVQACHLTRQMRPRVLHSFGYASRAGLVAATLSRTPFKVLSIRLDPQWASRWNWIFYRFAVSWADAVLANSCQAVHTLTTKGVTSEATPRVIYNGLDVDTFDGVPGKSQVAPFTNGDREKLRPGTKTICIVSNLRAPKGLDILLEAFANVQVWAPDTQLWVIGDGPLRSDLEARAQRLNLKDRVVFWGMREDVASLLRQVTIGVNSSRNEGLPNAIIEYMGARLPVVATKVGGTPELVVHGETGLLVPPNDPRALAEALLVVLRDPDIAHRMGQAGRRRVEELFTVERMVRETESVYETLLSRREC
jgi:glycosyltransferase involved in cell wall biosynthesis